MGLTSLFRRPGCRAKVFVAAVACDLFLYREFAGRSYPMAPPAVDRYSDRAFPAVAADPFSLVPVAGGRFEIAPAGFAPGSPVFPDYPFGITRAESYF